MTEFQLRDRDNNVVSLREEIDQLQQKQRSLKEELAERDGQLRVTRMNLETAHKQAEHHSQEVRGQLKLRIYFSI